MKHQKTGALCLALATAAGHAQVFDWALPVSDNWNTATNWSPANVPNAAGESAVIGIAGTYTVTVNTNPSIDALTVSNPDATVGIQGNRLLLVGAGGTDNDGTILVNDTASTFNAFLRATADSTLGGTGEVVLNGPAAADAQVDTNGGVTLTIASPQVIRGAGRVNGTGQITNQSLILADTAGEVLEIAGTIDNTAGTIRANPGIITLGAVTLTGGTIESGAGGVVQTVNTEAFFSGVTSTADVEVLGGDFLRLLGTGLVNNGAITVNANLSTFDCFIRFDASTSITGTGTITLNGPSANNDAQISTVGGVTGTIGSGQTVNGDGRITATAAGSSIINNGLVVADVDDRDLRISGTIAQGAGGIMRGNAGHIGLDNATITGGSFDGINGGRVDNAVGTSTVEAVTNTGEAGVRSGTTLAIGAGGFVNNGTLTMDVNGATFDCFLRFNASETLGGTGDVVLTAPSALNDSQIRVSTALTGTNGASHTIRGTGKIATDTDATFHNLGTVRADVLGADLAVEANVDQTGGGLLQGDSGHIALSSAFVTNGTFDGINGGRTDAAFGFSTVDGVTNIGDAGVRSGTTLALVGSGLTNDGTIVVDVNTLTFNSFLRFDDNTTLDGTGRVELTAPSALDDSNVVVGAEMTGTHGASHTIAGTGIVDASATNAMLVNNGLILADVAAADLSVSGNIDQSGGGTLRGDGGLIALSSATVTGGTFDGINGGRTDAAFGFSTVDGVTNIGDAGVRSGTTLALVGSGLTNDGTIVVDVNTLTFNSFLRFDDNTTLDGTGRVELTAPSALDDSNVVVGAEMTGTHGASHTIAGTGVVDASATNAMLVNNGLILADVATADLNVNGVIDQSGGGTLRADAGFIGLGGATVTGGTFDGINGGRVETKLGLNVVSAVTITGDAGIRGGTTMVVDGTLTNNGSIGVDSNASIFNAILRCDADASINGTGSIDLLAPTELLDSQLNATAGTLTLGAGQTLRGSGVLGGTIDCSATVAPGFSIGGFRNDGDLTLTPDAVYEVELEGTTSGTFDSIFGNGTVALGGTLDVTPINGYNPQWGDEYEIISANTVTGEFDTVLAPPLTGNLIYRVVYESNAVRLVISCPPDITDPFGTIDFFDVLEFLGLFDAMDPAADLVPPLGTWDVFDIIQYLSFFDSGCP